MVAISFSGDWTGYENRWQQKEAVLDKILYSRTKDQTIRKARKKPIKVGDKLQLYWGMRTRDCMKICDAECIETFKFEIFSSFLVYSCDKEPYNFRNVSTRKYDNDGVTITIGMDDDCLLEFIKRDGFDTIEQFFDYFEDGKYDVIRWKIIE